MRGIVGTRDYQPMRMADGPGGAPASGTGATGIDKTCIDTIRTLSMDAVQKAKSGHPGTPMALAPVAYTLWQDVLRYDPKDPQWPGRDRFVLSIGHASMLLYSLIYLTGIVSAGENHQTPGEPALSLDDLKQFRQLSSRTPGHPEYRHTSGVETTTGPLGQGCGNSVGMAMAERSLASRYNKPGFPIFDYHVYVLCGDGDMMEGVSSEAASVAGHLKLGNLTWIYDSNHITIEGATDLAFSESVHKRFEAYGWGVIEVTDANDTAALLKAIDTAKADTSRPTMIIVHSVIGYGAPKKAGTHSAHGEPLGDDEVRGAKHAYGWPEDKTFFVPDGVREHFQAKFGARGGKENAEWRAMLDRYRVEYPDLAREIDEMEHRTLPKGWDADIPVFPTDPKGDATRNTSGKVLNAIAPHVPFLIGGAADLAPSTKTNLTFQGAGSFEADNYGGRNLHFGIREHAMGSIANGMALAGLRVYVSGFLIFMDYMKPPIRLSSIMELPVQYIFTHDSIGVGEDGPTHQPIEQLAQLRATPGMITMRPGDANEVAEAWRVLLPLKERPSALILSRQNLPTLDRTKFASAKGVGKGGYVLADADKPKVILIATGSELHLAVEAWEKLKEEGIPARVVSLPSWELYEAQDQAYKDSVLPPDNWNRVTIEMSAALGWDRYAGPTGEVIGIQSFGSSAPLAALLDKYGFTVEKVVEAARKQAAKAG